MLDDNGDGRGTLAVQFRGVSPVPADTDVLPEGALANQVSLIPNPLERDWPPEEVAERDRLERELLRLRMNRDGTDSAAYLDAIESVLIQLAGLYERMEGNSGSADSAEDDPSEGPPPQPKNTGMPGDPPPADTPEHAG